MWPFSSRPRKGDRYIVTTGFVANVITTWRAPFSGGSEKELPLKLQFVIDQDPRHAMSAVVAVPEPYKDWEVTLVDESDLRTDNYDGYYLVIPMKSLRQNCMQIS